MVSYWGRGCGWGVIYLLGWGEGDGSGVTAYIFILYIIY